MFNSLKDSIKRQDLEADLQKAIKRFLTTMEGLRRDNKLTESVYRMELEKRINFFNSLSSSYEEALSTSERKGKE